MEVTATVIVCDYGDYQLTMLDRKLAEFLNKDHGKSIWDMRTKGWKWLWKRANTVTFRNSEVP